MDRSTLAEAGFRCQGKRTRRERFPGEMEQVIPWTALHGFSNQPTKYRSLDSKTHASPPGEFLFS